MAMATEMLVKMTRGFKASIPGQILHQLTESSAKALFHGRTQLVEEHALLFPLARGWRLTRAISKAVWSLLLVMGMSSGDWRGLVAGLGETHPAVPVSAVKRPQRS
jgi:hypothetical protein